VKLNIKAFDSLVAYDEGSLAKILLAAAYLSLLIIIGGSITDEGAGWCRAGLCTCAGSIPVVPALPSFFVLRRNFFLFLFPSSYYFLVHFTALLPGLFPSGASLF
jgi:hypothetical protein